MVTSIGTWPSSPLPHPLAIYRYEEYETVDDEGGVLIAPVDGAQIIRSEFDVERGTDGRGSLQVAGNTYLQLEHVDLRRRREILDFVNRYGPLYGEVYGRPPLLLPSGEIFDPGDPNERLDDFLRSAEELRELRKLAQVAQGVLDPTAIPNKYDDDPFDIFARRMNDVLSGFSPRIVPRSHWDDPFGGVEDQPPLFYICCLELFNHVAANAEYLVCEGCGMVFTPKRRDQLRYCTPACRKRTGQRRSKRKIRAKQREENPPLA